MKVFLKQKRNGVILTFLVLFIVCFCKVFMLVRPFINFVTVGPENGGIAECDVAFWKSQVIILQQPTDSELEIHQSAGQIEMSHFLSASMLNRYTYIKKTLI